MDERNCERCGDYLELSGLGQSVCWRCRLIPQFQHVQKHKEQKRIKNGRFREGVRPSRAQS